MLKKTITYENFDGEKVTEDCYFHLTQAEFMKLETSVQGGLFKRFFTLLGINAEDAAKEKPEQLEEVVKGKITEDSVPMLMDIFETIVINSYGKKSADGAFIKNQDIKDAFKCSEAYSALVMELLTDYNSATAFLTGIFPKSMLKQTETTK